MIGDIAPYVADGDGRFARSVARVKYFCSLFYWWNKKLKYDYTYKLPEILKKAFEKQKLYADKGKQDVKFYSGVKVLMKSNVKKNKVSDRFDGHHHLSQLSDKLIIKNK